MRGALIGLLLVGPGSLAAQTEALPDLSVPAGMVRRDFVLGEADLALVEQLCRDTLSADGKFHLLRTQRQLWVIDRPQQIETIRQMLPHLAQPAQNVRVAFTLRSSGQDSLRGVDVRGGVVVGGSARAGNLGGAVEIDLLNQRRGTAGLNQQFIVVRAGSEGFLAVERDVPMIDEFTRFIADGPSGAVLGIDPRILGNNVLFPLATGRFEVPEIRWEKAGSRIVVRPSVDGDLIHLVLIPQITSVVIVDPEALRRRGLNTYLTGREQYVSFTGLSTEVTIQNGATLTVGGFANANPVFDRGFFGSRSGGTSESGVFTVTASIE